MWMWLLRQELERFYLCGTVGSSKLVQVSYRSGKPGKLPFDTHAFRYQLEYGTDTLEIHIDGVEVGTEGACWSMIC